MQVFQDIRLAFRLFRRDFTATGIALLSIALNIAATAVVFTAVKSVLIDPLPYARPSELVQIRSEYPKMQEQSHGDWVFWNDTRELIRRTKTLESVGVYILFIASGAFHISKPSDLLPELQGRLPIRVELRALTRDDLRRILTEPEASLIKQYVALLATEGVTLEFSEDAIDAVADVAVAVNSSVENIGARRLQTVMERVLDEISFSASDRNGDTVKIDAAYVHKHIGDLAKNADLSRFIL